MAVYQWCSVCQPDVITRHPVLYLGPSAVIGSAMTPQTAQFNLHLLFYLIIVNVSTPSVNTCSHNIGLKEAAVLLPDAQKNLKKKKKGVNTVQVMFSGEIYYY